MDDSIHSGIPMDIFVFFVGVEGHSYRLRSLQCEASHRDWSQEMMLYEKWPCATIFEDDVGLATNFSQRVAAVTETWLTLKR